MTYEEFINNILETRGRFECDEEYHERHHIVPKCMGGTNDEENLIDLFAREHFEAHRLLALENPDNEKLVYAWWMMAHTNNANQRDYEITAEEYEEVKINISKKISGENNPMYGIKGELHPSYGIRRYGEDNPFYGKSHTEETKDKLRVYAKNRSDAHRKRISESKKGKRAYNKGVPMSDEQKEKLKASRKDKKRVMCIETNIIYESIGEASRNTNIDKTTISRCCNKKQKTAGGYQWCYIDEPIK